MASTFPGRLGAAAGDPAAPQDLPLDDLDVVIVENVGNLVCPAEFDVGETAKIAALSVTEGEDKPAAPTVPPSESRRAVPRRTCCPTSTSTPAWPTSKASTAACLSSSSLRRAMKDWTTGSRGSWRRAAGDAARERLLVEDAWEAFVKSTNRPDSGSATLRQYSVQWQASGHWRRQCVARDAGRSDTLLHRVTAAGSQGLESP